MSLDPTPTYDYHPVFAFLRYFFAIARRKQRNEAPTRISDYLVAASECEDQTDAHFELLEDEERHENADCAFPRLAGAESSSRAHRKYGACMAIDPETRQTSFIADELGAPWLQVRVLLPRVRELGRMRGGPVINCGQTWVKGGYPLTYLGTERGRGECIELEKSPIKKGTTPHF